MRWLILASSLLVACCAESQGGAAPTPQAVANADFSQITPDGQGLVGWAFSISRNARVSMTVDVGGGRDGTPAPRFHNESDLSPHIYGRFRQIVKVMPGLGYTLSCWVKGEKVRAGNHWTDWKAYTLALPAGTFDWTRVEVRFTTAADQTELDLGLNVVDVTDQLWVDDLELVPELTRGAAGEAWIGFWSAPKVAVEREQLAVRVWYGGLPVEAREVRVEVKAGDAVVGSLTPRPPLLGGEGELSGGIKVIQTPQHTGQVVVAVVDAAGEVIVSAQRPVELLSTAYARERLARVRAQREDLTKAMADWQRRKLPLDYPLVTATVTDNFLPWIEEDIARGSLTLALQEIAELEESLAGALAQCRKPPAVSALTVPRYTGGDVGIAGGHFAAQVRWPDGRLQRRPVFFMGYGHFIAVRRDIEKFPAYGLNIIQVEFGPRHVVQPDFSIKTNVIDDFVALLDRCAKAGVAANLLLSPHYFPGWAIERWPEIGGVNGGFIGFDIDAPQARQIEKAFLKAVIPRIKGHPALHSLCLSNEPIYVNAVKSEHNRRKWHEWLARRHGEVAALNALYGTTYASFEEVPPMAGEDGPPSPRLIDWVTFNNERFAGWHRWMADLIHEMAPEIPVHAKIMNTGLNRGCVGWGVDPEQFCDLSQLAGNDAVNVYEHNTATRAANGGTGEYAWYDLLRSMRGQPVFNSENHIVHDRNWQPVPGMHMRNLIWQGALHGLGASTTWVWERTIDPGSDFAGSIMHRPALCDAHGRTALDLMRLAPEIVALQDAPARVALVFSIPSMIWNPDYVNSTYRAYLALTLLGEKVDFLTPGQLARGEGRRYRAIVLTGITSMQEAGAQALQAFARTRGKQLLTTGAGTLAADEYNRPREVADLPLTVLTAQTGDDLRDELRSALRLDWPVRVVDAKTGQPAPNVGFRWARDGRRWLVNVCNYGREPAQVKIGCRGRSLTNLFTKQAVRKPVELGMMEPVLVEAR